GQGVLDLCRDHAQRAPAAAAVLLVCADHREHARPAAGAQPAAGRVHFQSRPEGAGAGRRFAGLDTGRAGAGHRRHHRRRALGRAALGLFIVLPVLGWLVGGASLTLDMPELKGFNFAGGLTLSPEFAALLAGLVIYTSAFIAEVVRSGIQAVNQGQWEAAGSL